MVMHRADSCGDISKALSQRLRAVSFLCAMLVVPIHAFSHTEWFEGTSSLRVWEVALATLLTGTVSRCAVPCFFVLSGFFLALKYEPSLSWYLKTIKKRFVTLYVPFVIWNVLYLIRNSVLEHRNLFSLDAVLGCNPFSVPGFSMFWYVQTILAATLLSPIWLPLARSRVVSVLSLVLLTTACLFGSFGLHSLIPFRLGPANFLWLFGGAFAAFHRDLASLFVRAWGGMLARGRLPCFAWRSWSMFLPHAFVTCRFLAGRPD